MTDLSEADHINTKIQEKLQDDFKLAVDISTKINGNFIEVDAGILFIFAEIRASILSTITQTIKELRPGQEYQVNIVAPK